MNNEDTAILKYFKDRKNGFYVDVGCYHPIHRNNTYLLHKQNWHGINIDTSQFSIDLFNYMRPKDLNYNCAISNKNEFIKLFYQKELSQLSTTEKNQAEIVFQGNIKEKEIEAFTLDEILNRDKYKNSKIDFEEYQINGDSIYFDRSINYASATNNIRILDTINKTLSTGHYAEIHRDIDSMFIQKRALIASFKEKDTTYIHGESIIITGKENEQIIRAFMNGKILRNNLSGKCDSIHFNQITGIAQLINKQKNSEIRSKKVKKPILWNNKSQITGDSIHIKFNIENNVIDSLFVFNNAFIIEKDTMELGFNQISGKRLNGNFIEGKLKEVDILKNAESVYYLRNSENELIGIDKSKSAKIKIFISEQNIDTFTKINQVDGRVYPENEFNENDKLLKGFYFREDEIIKTVNDLFLEDKKFKLTKIKHLD